MGRGKGEWGTHATRKKTNVTRRGLLRSLYFVAYRLFYLAYIAWRIVGYIRNRDACY